MAQYRTDLKKLDSQQVTTRYEVNMLSDQLTTGGNMVDAFGRLRVSNPHTLFDSTLRYTDDTREWDTALTGSGSFAHSLNTSSILMSVTTASGDKVIRQSKRYFVYQPGKSMLSMHTFTIQPKTNVRTRTGRFDARNGIFLEVDSGTVYIVKRSYNTGSAVDIRVAQSSWSEDKLDGTGYSKATLDISKTQILFIDIEWLGAGTVRIGFVINGVFYTAHKFHHANLITSTYMSTATLPVRSEIENTGTASSSTTYEHICDTVISEGGHTPRVTSRAVSNPLAGVTTSNVTYTPMIALRLKSTRSGGVVAPALANFYGLQNTPFNYKVLLDATVTGGTWVSAGDESHVEYNLTATSFTGGRGVLQGMFIGGTNVQPVTVNIKEFNSSFQLRTRIDGTNETFLLAAIATTNNDKSIGTLTWEEYN